MAAPASPATSMFSGIFGGGAPPSPTDTAAATASITNLNSGFGEMTSSLTSTMSVASSLSPSVSNMVDTTALTSALNATQNLQEACKGMTTDECAKKQAQLQADTDAAQLKFFQDTLVAQITELRAERDSIQTQYDKIKKEKEAVLKSGTLVFKGEPALAKYDSLLSEINADITTLQNSKPYIVPSTEGFQNSGSASTPVKTKVAKEPYQPPMVKTAGYYKEQHENILINYDALIGNPYDYNRVMRSFATFIFRMLVPIAFYVSLVFIAVWGGVMASNMCIEAEAEFLLGRIWYFVYGAIFFPIIILVSIMKPPFWVSGLFPLYPRTAKLLKTVATVANSINKGANTNATRNAPAEPETNAPAGPEANTGTNASAESEAT